MEGPLVQKMMQVGRRLSDLVSELDSAVNPNPDRNGFYVTIGKRDYNSEPIPKFSQFFVGTGDSIVNPYGSEAIKRFSAEKAFRLSAHTLIDDSAISSFQTANPELGRYSGAVAFSLFGGTHIISVSAYQESIDESVALILGEELGLGNKEFVNRVVGLSNNNAYFPLRELFDTPKNC